MSWFLSTPGELAVTFTAGLTGGHSSFLGLDVEARRAVVVLSNTGLSSVDHIGFHLLDPTVPLGPEGQVSADTSHLCVLDNEISVPGSAIWVSPGSDENQILDNTVGDVAGPAVFLEGDGNQVVTRSPADEVRDRGSGNAVTVRPSSEMLPKIDLR